MHITPIRTTRVEAGEELFSFLDSALPTLEEKSVVVVSGKIIALCENRVVPLNEISKAELVEAESDWFIPVGNSRYGVTLAVVRNQMFANAGIDESNSNGYYVLWPRDPQTSANAIWNHLRERHGLQELGVIIADSRLAPLYWGTMGAGIAHCGFRALNSKIGQSDLFGRELKFTQVSVVQGIAAAAVFEMGEADEQTPIAVATGIREIHFQERVPTEEELSALRIELEDDLYAPLLTSAKWQKGGGGYEKA